MAIRVMPFYAIILRPFVEQEISRSGWEALVRNAALGRFDGEIMAFGAMNPMDVDSQCEFLEGVGYRGPSHGDAADFAVFEMGFGRMPNWLECVDVRHFGEETSGDTAWKMRDSQVYTLHDFHESQKLPTKGYEVDWPPYIGKIS